MTHALQPARKLSYQGGVARCLVLKTNPAPTTRLCCAISANSSGVMGRAGCSAGVFRAPLGATVMKVNNHTCKGDIFTLWNTGGPLIPQVVLTNQPQ